MRIVLIIPESSKSERDCLGRRKEFGLGMLYLTDTVKRKDMKKTGIIDPEYLQWIKELSLRYRRGQIKAAVKVNQEMLRYYWDLGKDIVQRDAENKYGSGFYSTLSRDIKLALNKSKGLSERNLLYAKEFYLLYFKEDIISPQVVAKLLSFSIWASLDLSIVFILRLLKIVSKLLTIW